MSNLMSGQVSRSDLEDICYKANGMAMQSLGIDQGGLAYDQYRRSGSYVDPIYFDKYTKTLISQSYKSMGHGSDKNIIQNFVSRLDRHGRAIVPMNNLNYGYTFITRPRLNLSGSNLTMAPLLASLYSADPRSIPFMIRGLLDTRLSSGLPVYCGSHTRSSKDIEARDFGDKAVNSGLMDVFNPFLIPVCNALKGISGFPDFVLETETTEGDFYSSDYTFARGSDMNQRSTELSLEFRDTPGSIILAIFYYWAYYTALQCRGVLEPYQDDVYEGLLNYTFSIYRFVTDHSRRRIHHWAKATGCIVKSIPIGSIFNITQGETFITSATNFSIPVSVNKIEYNHPDILRDFNTLMQRYCPYITNDNYFYSMSNRSNADFNFMGLPYITQSKYSIDMDWRTSARYYDNLNTTAQSTKAAEQLLSVKERDVNSLISGSSTNSIRDKYLNASGFAEWRGSADAFGSSFIPK